MLQLQNTAENPGKLENPKFPKNWHSGRRCPGSSQPYRMPGDRWESILPQMMEKWVSGLSWKWLLEPTHHTRRSWELAVLERSVSGQVVPTEGPHLSPILSFTPPIFFAEQLKPIQREIREQRDKKVMKQTHKMKMLEYGWGWWGQNPSYTANRDQKIQSHHSGPKAGGVGMQKLREERPLAEHTGGWKM